jgi:hypothetical protein
MVMTEKEKKALADELRNDKEFMDGVRRGLQDYHEGKVRLWSEVRKELGLGEANGA